MLEVIVYVIRVIFREIDKCIKENRGYNTLFIVGI